VRFLLRLVELELIDRERRMVERRIRAAWRRASTLDFAAIPPLNKPLTLELARCEYVVARGNVIAVGNSGTGKTHVCLPLGLAGCLSVSFITAAGLVHQLMEARDEKRLLSPQTQLAAVKLLIVDELGYVPFSRTGGNCSSRYSANVTSPDRRSSHRTSHSRNGRASSAIGADGRLTRSFDPSCILEPNGESYRLKQSKARRRQAAQPVQEIADPEAGETSDD